jgi:hypothetical protein
MRTFHFYFFNALLFIALGMIWLAIRTNSSTDLLSGIGLLLLWAVIGTLISMVRYLWDAQMEKSSTKLPPLKP